MIRVTFLPMNQTVEAEAGTTLLEAAHDNGLPLEGACEGALACSTCHVLVHPDWYGRLDPPDEKEEDMLDKAFGLTPVSRLGCQIVLDETLDGLIVTIPPYSVNISVEKKGVR